MKTLQWVKEHIDEVEQDDFMDHRFTKRFLDFLPVAEWEHFGFCFTGKVEPEVKEWTEENVLAQLKSDVEFAIEKSTNHRGISASLMYAVLKAWCIVLENGLEDTPYGYYGDELIKEVDKYYNFGLVTEETFNKDFYGDWS